jgi:uncharacterized protein YwgA
MTVKKNISGKDLLLTLLYCPGLKNKTNEPIVGRTKLTKMVFLFDKEIKNEFFKDIAITIPNFEPYNFGPYSKELFDDLRFFLAIGLVKGEETSIPISSAEKSEYIYSTDDNWDDHNQYDTDYIESEIFELKYSLSSNGVRYVEDNIWGLFSEQQKKDLIEFKKRINTISLDTLLRYVYNKYKDSTAKSIIADKYLSKDGSN